MIKKRLVQFLTAAVLTLTLLPCLPVSAADKEITADGLNYTISNGVATLTGAAESPQNLVIPSKVSGVPVTEIAEKAFYHDKTIRTVSIPSSVKTIGNYAFSCCNLLNEVTMAEGVTTMGYSVFSTSALLRNISFPKTLTSIGSNCFRNTMWLENKQKESKWVAVNGILIDGSTCTTSCTVPTSIKTILTDSFNDAKGLYRIVLPKHIDYLPQGAIASCPDLQMVTIGNPNCRFGCEEADHKNCPCCIYNRVLAIWRVEYDGIIRGYLGSTAQTYARNHTIPFLGLGDVTGDGVLTADDANYILIEYLSTTIMNQGKTLTQDQRFASDYDLDAYITPDDASAVLQVYLENMMK
ncbi:MAG: leucine-rich repeat protein [Oscillospiraceae bacterium]|nr:leucine-rich repeat protein [Oscillospiraceae bacterium]